MHHLTTTIVAAGALAVTSGFAVGGDTLYEVEYAEEQLFGFVPYSSASPKHHPDPGSLYNDDFMLDEAADLTGIGWHGYSDFWDTPDLTNFTVWQVRIYQGDGQGEPGALLYDNVFDKADTNPQALGPDGLFGSTMYYHEVDLGETIELEADTQYWVGIGADAIDPSSDLWIWAEAPPGDQTIARWVWDDEEWIIQGPDFGGDDEPFNVSFSLIGEVSEAPVGDLDDDGNVGTNDLLILLGEWGPCADPCPPSCDADLDDDCEVGTEDLLTLLANWG